MTPEQEELRGALRQLRRAILDKGKHPKIHDRIEFVERRRWPTLWRALDRVLAATSAFGDLD